MTNTSPNSLENSDYYKLKEPSMKYFWIAGLFFTLYLLTVVGIYLFNFHAFSISRSDPAAWSDFGGYFSGMLSPPLALLNALVVFYIATTVKNHYDNEIRRLAKNEEEKARSEAAISLLIELHREWNTEFTYKSRKLALDVVRFQPYMTLEQIEAQQRFVSINVTHVWVVANFFFRLFVLVQNKRVDPKLTQNLFGELFVWWWYNSFKYQVVPLNYTASRGLIALSQWFMKECADEWARWKIKAADDLESSMLDRNDFTGFDLDRHMAD